MWHLATQGWQIVKRNWEIMASHKDYIIWLMISVEKIFINKKSQYWRNRKIYTSTMAVGFIASLGSGAKLCDKNHLLLSLITH
jgi:hypothetical protein